MIHPMMIQWRMQWGTPAGFFGELEGKKMTIAFGLAILFHALPFIFLWQHHSSEKVVETVTLQNVDFIDLEQPKSEPPPVVEVQKPKSALEFIKMALPSFSKPAPVDIPREVVVAPKNQGPVLAEAPLLMEKKTPVPAAGPEIQLKLNKSGPGPSIAEISKLSPGNQRNPVKTAEPALKLEEVGKRAVRPQSLGPAIVLNPSGKAAEVGSLPPLKSAVPTRSGSSEKIVDRTAPPMSPSSSLPKTLGYGKTKNEPAVSLEPRSYPDAQKAPEVARSVAEQTPKKVEQNLEISKEKVKITGPLSSRKIVKSVVPVYPAWARARNIEAESVIRFTVSAEGEVRENPVIVITSGYPEMDRLALEALMKWKFSSLTGGAQDQWGEITFKFLLD